MVPSSLSVVARILVGGVSGAVGGYITMVTLTNKQTDNIPFCPTVSTVEA